MANQIDQKLQESRMPSNSALSRKSVNLTRLNLRHSSQRHSASPSHVLTSTDQPQLTPPPTPRSLSDLTGCPMDSVGTGFPNYLRAFYHFHPASTVSSVAEQSSITVAINQGDVILVHSVQPNGWADGTLLASGARGWLPTNYCEPYNPYAMRDLLKALMHVWDVIGSHEDDNRSIYAKQDYARRMVAGVRVLLERCKCLDRASPMVQCHGGIRRMRRGLLSDLSSFAKAVKSLQESRREPESSCAPYYLHDDIVLKAFSVVTRGVKLLDIWIQNALPKQCVEVAAQGASLPLTPPADASFDPSPLPLASHSIQNKQFIDLAWILDFSKCGVAAVPVQRSPADTRINNPARLDRALVTHNIPTSVFRQRTAGPPVTPPLIVQQQASAYSPLSSDTRFPVSDHHVVASEQLCNAHDAFLGYLGAFIGLHLESRSAMDVFVTTQKSVAACQSLLYVVERTWQHDLQRSTALEQAKDVMQARLSELVQATRDIFKLSDIADVADVFLPGEGKRLVEAATFCVRAAGDCVARTRSVIERIGDFRLELASRVVSGVVSANDLPHRTPYRDSQANAEGCKISGKSSSTRSLTHASENIVPLPPLHPPPLPPATKDPDSQRSSTGRIATPANQLSSCQQDTTSLARSSLETASPSAHGEDVTHSQLTEELPVLAVHIPPPTPFDCLDLSRSSDVVEGKTIFSNSISASLSGPGGNGPSTIREAKQSLSSQVSMQLTTPKQILPHESDSNHQNTGSENLVEPELDLDEQLDQGKAQTLAETYAHELLFNKDGQITGGSLPALVERLTAHDSTPEALFVNTFHLTFRLFTTPTEFAQALVDRFDYVGENHSLATPVRLRVYNVFKGWLETYWRSESDDQALRIILNFATGRLRMCLPSASKRLIELTVKVSEQRVGPILPRSASTIGKSGIGTSSQALMENAFPSAVITKSQLNLLRNPKAAASATIVDFDPLELARQFTIIESRIFNAIQPEELLSLEWTKKTDSLAVNVRAMSTLSTDLANLVADTVLQLEEPKKRAVMIKQWVKIAKKCAELHNYDSLMAIICSLNSSMVLRLKKTWDILSPKTLARLEYLKGVVDVSRNYAVLRQRLQSLVGPCLPFVGMYLTDLTFVDVGNQTTRQLLRHGAGEPVSVINFDKHMKTAKIVGDLQRFQVPYRLTPVPEMQEWMDVQIRRVRASGQANVQSYYRRSLLLEPRDLSHDKKSSPSVDSVASSFGSTVSTSSTVGEKNTKERFDFWNTLAFATTAGTKEKMIV